MSRPPWTKIDEVMAKTNHNVTTILQEMTKFWLKSDLSKDSVHVLEEVASEKVQVRFL